MSNGLLEAVTEGIIEIFVPHYFSQATEGVMSEQVRNEIGNEVAEVLSEAAEEVIEKTGDIFVGPAGDAIDTAGESLGRAKEIFDIFSDFMDTLQRDDIDGNVKLARALIDLIEKLVPLSGDASEVADAAIRLRQKLNDELDQLFQDHSDIFEPNLGPDGIPILKDPVPAIPPTAPQARPGEPTGGIPDDVADQADDHEDTKNISSPLVLDLDGDGIELASLTGSDSVFWDIDEDGFIEKSGWISGGDGLLTIDLNSDGIINDHGELFGTETTDGFTVLSAYDTNSDNLINSSDAQFNDLLVWVDANSNGYSESTELSSLTDLGITEISLAANLVNYEIAGNPITHESTFTINGQTQTIVDAWFSYDNTNSKYHSNYTLDARAIFMPTLRGYGDVPDLHIAMSQDETLLFMLRDIATESAETILSPVFDIQNRVTDIFFRWTGADTVDPSSRGPYFDGQKIAAMEVYFGNNYVNPHNSTDVTRNASDPLNDLFDDIIARLTKNILSQTSVSQLLDEGAYYDFVVDEVISDETDFIEFIPSDLTGLQGTAANEAYLFQNTSDTFTLYETGGHDEIWLAGVDESEVRLEKLSSHLYIHYDDKYIKVNHQFMSDLNNTTDFDEHQVEWLHLDDGTKIDLLNNVTFKGTDGVDQILHGTNGNDTLLGLAGDDSLTAFDGDDILIGGAGTDYLSGGAGNDIYEWSAGDGSDFIYETGGTDTLVFDETITLADLTFSQLGNDLKITFGDVITVDSFYNNSVGSKLEEIGFSDGSTLDLIAHLNRDPTAFDDTFLDEPDAIITGNVLYNNGNGADSDPDGHVLTVVAGTYSTTNGSVVLSSNGDFTYTPDAGYAGADSFVYTVQDVYGATDTASVSITLNSSANNPNAISGTSSNETLNGDPNGSSNDTLIGYGGNDTLNGKLGNDSYIWSVGDGNDFINETGGADQLVLQGVLESALRFEKSGSYHLKIHVGSESITLNNHLYADTQSNSYFNSYHIETLALDDGTTIDLTGGLTFTGTASNENLYGLNNEDSVLHGLVGTDTLHGYNANDTLIGGLGNDTLNGRAGNDSYIWSIGDGDDTINETGGVDQLVLHGVDENALRFEKSGSYNLKIHVGSESITLNSHLYSDTQNNTAYDGYHIETLALDDGTVVDLTGGLTFTGTANNENLYGLSNSDSVLYGLDGADTLHGYGANDTLVGGLGNDTLNGRAGDDTYIWSVGDGNDFINETSGADQLILHGVIEDDLRFEKSGSYNLKIHVGSESITLNSHLYSDTQNNAAYDGYHLEHLILDDGTVIDLTGGLTFTGTMNNENIYGLSNSDSALYGLQGTDTLHGYAGNDTLVGGAGNDTLNGRAGDDTYIWSVGDGSDTINETGGLDQLLLSGVTEADIRFEKSGSYHLKIHIDNESITLNSQLYSDYQNNSAYDSYRIESLSLDNGTSIDLTSGLTFTGTANNENMYGLQQSDSVLNGLDGNDTLRSYNGSDTLHGGNGSDYLYGGNNDDTLLGGDGIDMLYGQAGADTFVFEAISAFSNSDNIQDFKLSDGDKLDVSDLLQGYDPLVDAISDFVEITESGSNSYLHVDADGGADNFVQIAYIYNETGLTDEDALETSGTLITV